MSFPKSLIAAVALCGALIPSANATDFTNHDFREGTIGGYRAGILDSGSYGVEDYIEVHGPRGKEQIWVQCSPFDWQSKGPNSSAFANHIAEQWCF